MSALGVIPGFAYPELDYGGTEFVHVFPNVVVPGGGGSVVATLVSGGDGAAFYPDDVEVVMLTSALVGNRAGAIVLQDPDGNFSNFYSNPLLVPASNQNNWIWSQKLTSAYTGSGTGYSPMQNVILLPGYNLAVVIQGLQAGDTVKQSSVIGRKIPFGITQAAQIAAVAPVLLT